MTHIIRLHTINKNPTYTTHLLRFDFADQCRSRALRSGHDHVLLSPPVRRRARGVLFSDFIPTSGIVYPLPPEFNATDYKSDASYHSPQCCPLRTLSLFACKSSSSSPCTSRCWGYSMAAASLRMTSGYWGSFSP